jgi:hypothetical protein
MRFKEKEEIFFFSGSLNRALPVWGGGFLIPTSFETHHLSFYHFWHNYIFASLKERR